VGQFYALIALGYSMVYSILMLFNFAHGDIFMVGAYIGLGVATGPAGLFGAALPGWMILVMTILISMFLTAFVGITWNGWATGPCAMPPAPRRPSPD
jgi:branched-chain amino acid transport system permease protein